VNEAAYERARRAFLLWSLRSLLFAWLLFVGDPLSG